MKITFIVVAILLALGIYWALSTVGAAPRYVCRPTPDGLPAACGWQRPPGPRPR
jgi:hypothetical protein